MIDLEWAVSLLRGAQDIEILNHHFPDGDTLGRAAALCRALQLMGERARCTCADPVLEKYDFLLDEIRHQEFPIKSVISVDVADTKLLRPVLTTEHADKIDLYIDHHGSHQDFAENSYVGSTATAACEIVYEVIRHLGVVPNQAVAQTVCTGITTDTGCFRYSNTTARTHEIVTQVIRTGIDAGDINRRVFGTKTRARLEIEHSVLDLIVFYFDTRHVVIYISRVMIEASGTDRGDLDSLSATPRQIESVLVGVTMRKHKIGSYKASLHTQPQVNAAKIYAEFDGDGHVTTADCTIGEDFESAREKLLTAIGKVLETI